MLVLESENGFWEHAPEVDPYENVSVVILIHQKANRSNQTLYGAMDLERELFFVMSISME